MTEGAKGKRSKIAAVLRTIFYALLFAFIFGFVFGTLIRQKLERPKRYIGMMRIDEPATQSESALGPGDVRDAEPRILMPRHHEEQVG